MSKIVTIKEVAEYLRLSPMTIINLAVNGNIPGFKIGKSWRFDWDEILTTVDVSKGKLQNSRQ